MGYEGAQGILYKFGVNAVEIAFAVPTLVGSTPAGSQRDSPSVQIVISGLQRGLNKLGAGLTVDGALGLNTQAAIDQVSDRYQDKKWIEIYADVDVAIRAGYTMPRIVDGRSSSPPFSPATGAIPWTLVAVGGVAAFLILR